jgi:hypothetical protein
MDKQLYFELLVELSRKDIWVHYYFVYYKTFVIFSFFFFLSMIPSLTLYKLKIPSTIRQWNSLDPSLRNVDSIAKFKTELRKQKDISQVPTHYEIVPRKLNIILTQLRLAPQRQDGSETIFT